MVHAAPSEATELWLDCPGLSYPLPAGLSEEGLLMQMCPPQGLALLCSDRQCLGLLHAAAAPCTSFHCAWGWEEAAAGTTCRELGQAQKGHNSVPAESKVSSSGASCQYRASCPARSTCPAVSARVGLPKPLAGLQANLSSFPLHQCLNVSNFLTPASNT